MKITKTMQKVAVDILSGFMYTRNMDEVIEVYQEAFERYGLCKDPFTGYPCTPDEWCDNQLEYEKQTMIE